MKVMLAFAILSTLVLMVSWHIQETDQILGYTVGVFGFLAVFGYTIDLLTRNQK
jgi:hypothetical protein